MFNLKMYTLYLFSALTLFSYDKAYGGYTSPELEGFLEYFKTKSKEKPVLLEMGAEYDPSDYGRRIINNLKDNYPHLCFKSRDVLEVYACFAVSEKKAKFLSYYENQIKDTMNENQGDFVKNGGEFLKMAKQDFGLEDFIEKTLACNFGLQNEKILIDWIDVVCKHILQNQNNKTNFLKKYTDSHIEAVSSLRQNLSVFLNTKTLID